MRVYLPHCFFFFFNDTATTEIYTLSLHDALPIWPTMGGSASRRAATRVKPEQASKGNRERRPALKTGKAAGARRSNRPEKARSLTGVGGVARRHRAWRQAGAPARRGVAALSSGFRREPRWVSEGSTVPFGLTRQQNWWGGRGPWFGVCLNGPRGGRLA